MKKAGVSSIVFPLLLLLANPAFASTTITTGDSTAEVHVQTNSYNSSSNDSTSNIHTHIEVETNGDKKVLDEEGPGNYTVTSKSENGGESSVNVTTNTGNNSETEDSTKSADTKREEKVKEHVTPVSFIVSIFQNVGGFFLRILRNL